MRAANGKIRSGFTLIEMILVMAMMVMLMAIIIPTTQAILADARVSAAADMIRGQLADARSKAMEQGRCWRIGYIPGSDVVQLAPDDASDWDNANHDETESENLIRVKFPKDVILASSKGAISSSGPGATGGGNWETMAVYLPDGSAKDDVTTYFGKAGQIPMRVCVRGLTGAVGVEKAIIVQGD